MNEVSTNPTPDTEDYEKMKSLKTLTGVIYLCQLLAFAFAGAPLLVGVALNFINRSKAQGTWLQSHFNWQIKTVWVTLLLLAIAGLTFATPVGVIILLPTIVWLVYRIVLGWNALNSNKPVKAGLI